MLTTEISNPTGQPFDLTDDGLVDSVDLDELVENILNTRYGDTDLNGTVDEVDFQTLASNFGSRLGSWDSGDTDGDGDFTDFNRL